MFFSGIWNSYIIACKIVVQSFHDVDAVRCLCKFVWISLTRSVNALIRCPDV